MFTSFGTINEPIFASTKQSSDGDEALLNTLIAFNKSDEANYTGQPYAGPDTGYESTSQLSKQYYSSTSQYYTRDTSSYTLDTGFSTSSGSARVDSWISDYDDSTATQQSTSSDAIPQILSGTSSDAADPASVNLPKAAQTDVVRCPAGTRAVGFSFLPNDYGMEQLEVSICTLNGDARKCTPPWEGFVTETHDAHARYEAKMRCTQLVEQQAAQGCQVFSYMHACVNVIDSRTPASAC